MDRYLRIAVDIGGTFTDGVAEDVRSGRIWLAKTLTTNDDPGAAISLVLEDLLRQTKAAGLNAANINDIVHGTTRVTNALIERDGAKVGLLLTQGTRDCLDIRRETRYDLYDLDISYPEPLASLSSRAEVKERLNARGEILIPLDVEGLAKQIEYLRNQAVEAIAICFLHAPVSDRHEKQAFEEVSRLWPEIPLSTSTQVAREIREYERMSTVAANAYVQPLMSNYLQALEGRLAKAKIDAPLRIMISSGGFTSSAAAAAVPLALLESGPAGGVLSGIQTAKSAGHKDLLAFDMGGTTAKAGLCLDGRPALTHQFEAGRVHRFKKGSGFPIMLPSIDLIEIGAGGGSIAHKSALGLLNVGPRSAGAIPGPACYGQGGLEPTVTDADLLLGYLDSDFFLGGDMQLHPDKAEAAVTSLATTLDMPIADVVFGIFDLVNENMAVAARVHVAEKGVDPRRLTLVATGGAGPVHAVEVAHKIGLNRILCSIAAGAGSCLGLLSAPARVDRSWSKVTLLRHVNWPECRDVLQELKQHATRELIDAGGAPEQLFWLLNLEMRYAGQGDTIAVELVYDNLATLDEAETEARFAESYENQFGRTVPDGQLEVVTWRLTGQSDAARRDFNFIPDEQYSAEPIAEHEIFLTHTKSYGAVPIYDRYGLPPGTKLSGPLILRERESTIVVARPATTEILPDLSVAITLPEDRYDNI